MGGRGGLSSTWEGTTRRDSLRKELLGQEGGRFRVGKPPIISRDSLGKELLGQGRDRFRSGKAPIIPDNLGKELLGQGRGNGKGRTVLRFELCN